MSMQQEQQAEMACTQIEAALVELQHLAGAHPELTARVADGVAAVRMPALSERDLLPPGPWDRIDAKVTTDRHGNVTSVRYTKVPDDPNPDGWNEINAQVLTDYRGNIESVVYQRVR